MEKPNPDDRGKAKLEGNDDKTCNGDAPSASVELPPFSLFSVDPSKYFLPADFQIPWKTQTPLTREQISKDEQTERLHLPPAESSTKRSVSLLGTEQQKYSTQEFKNSGASGASSSSQMGHELQQAESLPGYGAPRPPLQASGADAPPQPQVVNNDTNFPELPASRVANPALPALDFRRTAIWVPPPAGVTGDAGDAGLPVAPRDYP